MGGGSSRETVTNVVAKTYIDFIFNYKISVQDLKDVSAFIEVKNSVNTTINNAKLSAKLKTLEKQVDTIQFSSSDIDALEQKLKENLKTQSSGNLVDVDKEKTITKITKELTATSTVDIVKDEVKKKVVKAYIQVINSASTYLKNVDLDAVIDTMTTKVERYIRERFTKQKIDLDADITTDRKVSGLGDNLEDIAKTIGDAFKSIPVTIGVVVAVIFITIIIIIAVSISESDRRRGMGPVMRPINQLQYRAIS